MRRGLGAETTRATPNKRSKHEQISKAGQLTLNQRVPSSSPGAPTKQIKYLQLRIVLTKIAGQHTGQQSEILCSGQCSADSGAGNSDRVLEQRFKRMLQLTRRG